MVQKDDLLARYPLARQLLKIFVNEENGETILVPAKIYGAYGVSNSWLRDALQNTTTAFVAQHNGNKDGVFSMDNRLYADGQARVVRLQGDWSAQSIQSALQQYQDGAAQEWLVELKTYQEYVKNGKLGRHGEDPAETIKKLSSKLRRVWNTEDNDSGLSRMFYREMKKTSLGVLPSPQAILDAIATDSILQASDKAFAALWKEDATAWEMQAVYLTPYQAKQIAFIVAVTANKDSTIAFAAAAWHKTLQSYQSVPLVNAFDCKEIIVVEQNNGTSTKIKQHAFCDLASDPLYRVLNDALPYAQATLPLQCAIANAIPLLSTAEQKSTVAHKIWNLTSSANIKALALKKTVDDPPKQSIATSSFGIDVNNYERFLCQAFRQLPSESPLSFQIGKRILEYQFSEFNKGYGSTRYNNAKMVLDRIPSLMDYAAGLVIDHRQAMETHERNARNRYSGSRFDKNHLQELYHFLRTQTPIYSALLDKAASLEKPKFFFKIIGDVLLHAADPTIHDRTCQMILTEDRLPQAPWKLALQIANNRKLSLRMQFLCSSKICGEKIRRNLTPPWAKRSSQPKAHTFTA